MSRSAAASCGLVVVALGLLADALAGGGLGNLLVTDLALVPLAYAAGLSSRRTAAAAAVTTAVPALVLAAGVRDPGAHTPSSNAVFYGVLLAAPTLAGAATAAVRAQSRLLARQTEALRSQRADDLRAARAEERHRVEVLLHRGFSEDLAAIALAVEGARHDARSARTTLAACEEQARGSLQRLREALGSLRAPDLQVAADTRHVTRARERAVRGTDLTVAAGASLLVAVELVLTGAGPGTLLVVVATAGVVVVRRSLPLASAVAWLAVLVVWSASTLQPPSVLVTPLVPAVLVAFAVGAHTRGGRRVVAAATLPLGAVVVGVSAPASEPDPAALPGLLLLLALALLGGVTAQRWSARADHLAAGLGELRRGAEVQVRLARAQQRLDLAAELHDAVAHAMTVVCVQSAAAATLRDDDLDAVIDDVVTTARSGLAELRHGLDGLGRADDLDAEQVADLARRAGLVPRVEVADGVADLEPHVRRLALRVVREGLVNAGRHAPGSAIDVLVDRHGGDLGVVVRDRPVPRPGRPCPGRGTAAYPYGTGTGLLTLAEAVRAAGGSLRWGPRGDAFELRARLRVTP